MASASTDDGGLALETVLAEFENSALSVFRSARENTHALESRNSIETLVSALQDRLRITLVPELRAYNAGQLTRLGLPDEIWCMVWDQLSMFDCVAISQVCHHWREFAIGSPRLWLAPHFFSCSHSSGCACTSCTALDVAGINPRNHTGPTNFELVTHILERRTANLPLRVHLTVVAAWTDRNAVAHLSYTLLTDYAHRLVELSFVTEDTSIPREFMIHCVELPALRSFVCRNLDSGAHDSEGLFDEPISLPALEYLELDGPIHNRGFPPWEARLSFPFVQTLRVFVWDPVQLNADVAACPAVERLILTVHRNFQAPREHLDADQARARSIEDVHISLDVPGPDVGDILFLTENPARAAMVIDLKATIWYGVRVVCSSLEILRDLGSPTAFSYLALDNDAHPLRVSILLREGDERYREVRTPRPPVIIGIWDYIHTSSLVSLVVGWNIWVSLFHGQHPLFPALRHVEFVVSALSVTFDGSLPSSLPSPAMLETLRFTKPEGSAAVVDAEALVAFVSALRRDGPLLHLVALRNVTPIDPSASFEGISERFEVTA